MPFYWIYAPGEKNSTPQMVGRCLKNLKRPAVCKCKHLTLTTSTSPLPTSHKNSGHVQIAEVIKMQNDLKIIIY